MRVFLGMILGALLLVVGVYTYDSMQTSTVANGQVAEANRTIVNWDVAATDWTALKAEYRQAWANYYVRYIQEYAKEGVASAGIVLADGLHRYYRRTIADNR